MPAFNDFKPTTQSKFDLERFFEMSLDFLCIAGHDGYLKKVNPAFSKIMGYSVQELLSKPINDLIYEEDREITAVQRSQVKANVPLLNYENRYVTKTGGIIWLSWTSISESGNNLIYAIAKDITHIKKLETERNLLLANLTQFNTELKQLTYTISHDLRAPVNNLLSLFNLLEIDKIEDPETQEYVKLLESSSLSLNNTLNNYLDDLAKKDTLKLEMENLNLEEILELTLDSIKSLVENSKASIKTDFSEFNEILCNHTYLQSIFLNLISNSIKYARPGISPAISIGTKKTNHSKQLIFEDNGLGFDMDQVKNKVFGLGQKFHNHSDSKGIGLYLIHNYMHSLGGNISLESKLNQGSKFTLCFRE